MTPFLWIFALSAPKDQSTKNGIEKHSKYFSKRRKKPRRKTLQNLRDGSLFSPQIFG